MQLLKFRNIVHAFPYPISFLDYERFANSDCSGNDLPGSAVSETLVQDCEQQCDNDYGCLGIVFKQEDSLCWLKSSCDQGQLIGLQGVDAYIDQGNLPFQLLTTLYIIVVIVPQTIIVQSDCSITGP